LYALQHLELSLSPHFGSTVKQLDKHPALLRVYALQHPELPDTQLL
jgi:hypothetical protein